MSSSALPWNGSEMSQNSTLITFASWYIVPEAENILSVPITVLNYVQQDVLYSSPEASWCDQKTELRRHWDTPKMQSQQRLQRPSRDVCTWKKEGRQRECERNNSWFCSCWRICVMRSITRSNMVSWRVGLVLYPPSVIDSTPRLSLWLCSASHGTLGG